MKISANVPIDPELETLRATVIEMEEEVERIEQMPTGADEPMAGSATGSAEMSLEEKQEVDTRSVYVGNVDYYATAEKLELHFRDCGIINRITILSDKDGQPKGFAYIEFSTKEFAQISLRMNNTLFYGREIKVLPKRTNIPRFSKTNRPPRGGYRGRGQRLPHIPYMLHMPFGSSPIDHDPRTTFGYPGHDYFYDPYF